jgi:hypothetical protein
VPELYDQPEVEVIGNVTLPKSYEKAVVQIPSVQVLEPPQSPEKSAHKQNKTTSTLNHIAQVFSD